MSVRTVEQAVRGSGGGEVKVRREGDTITVTWFCGASRAFTVEQVKQHIVSTDRLKGAGGGVWMTLPTKRGIPSSVSVRLSGGRLYAEEGPADENDEENSVNWAAMKKALKNLT